MDRRAALCELFCASPAIALARQGLHGVCCASTPPHCLGIGVLVVAVATGIYGMDFYVVLGRRGKRVGRRKHQTGRVGAPHRLTKADAMAWFQATYEGTFRK